MAFTSADFFATSGNNCIRPKASLSPFPHLSLAYGNLPVREKIARSRPLAGAIEGRTIKFDRLAVALSGKDIPVDEWRVVATVQLGSDPASA